MIWFEGSIPDAIASAKQQGFVFIVVVIGQDEQSAQLISSWENDEVSKALQNCCVAIKIDAKSETCVQFSQIYPVVCIPSSFFIGESGIPLEVIAGNVSPEELMKRITRVKQMQLQQVGGGYVLGESSSHVGSSIHNNSATAPKSTSAPVGPICSAAVATELAATPETVKASPSSPALINLAENSSLAPECANSEENLDSKVERLTRKLEAKREEKKRGEEENETQKEMERRKTGKDLLDFKRKQEEEKTKRILEERNKDKAEDRAARERVKQQIAMDRADRAARYSKTQEEEKTTKEHLLQAKQESLLRQRSTIARIQFRLPDGSSFTNQFSSESRLHEARNFALQEVGSRFGNFSLATMFPRREFTMEDLNKTLLELELAPSASIVLLPQSGRSANTQIQSAGGGLWAILGTFLYPLLAVWRFLSSFLFVAPLPSRASSREPAQDSMSSSVREKEKRETLSKHTLEKQSKDFKKEGKVCRLRTQEDSEDDTNTWNGNSTQQM